MLTFAIDDDRRLRPYEETDAEALYAVIDANRAMLAQWLPWAAGETLEDARQFIVRNRRESEEEDALELAIVSEDEIVGGIGFIARNRADRSSEIGYWLSAAHQGRGTMTAAAAALIDWGFTGPWQLHRIQIQAGIGNAPSRAIPERLGFTWEGTRRGAGRIGEHFIDLAVYGLLVGEWAGYPAA